MRCLFISWCSLVWVNKVNQYNWERGFWLPRCVMTNKYCDVGKLNCYFFWKQCEKLMTSLGWIRSKQWVQSRLMEQTKATGSNDWEDEVNASASAQLLREGREKTDEGCPSHLFSNVSKAAYVVTGKCCQGGKRAARSWQLHVITWCQHIML